MPCLQAYRYHVAWDYNSYCFRYNQEQGLAQPVTCLKRQVPPIIGNILKQVTDMVGRELVVPRESVLKDPQSIGMDLYNKELCYVYTEPLQKYIVLVVKVQIFGLL